MRLSMLPFVITLAVVLACCKKDAGNPPVNPPPTDTLPVRDSTPSSSLKDSLGTGWSKVTVAGTQAVDIDFVNNNVGYLLTTSGLYKSVDSGHTWQKPCGNCTATGGYMYAMNDGRVWYSTPPSNYISISGDGGASVTQALIGHGWPGGDFFMLPNDTGYALGNASNIIMTTDKGASWNLVSSVSGLALQNVLDNSLLFWSYHAALISDGINVFHTVSDIHHWQQSSGITDTRYGQSVLFGVNDSVVYFIKNITPNVYLYKSVDGGSSFTLMSTLAKNTNYCDIHFTSVTTGYLSANNEIYKTVDSGTTWTKVVSLDPARHLIELDFTDPDHGWACGLDSMVLIYKN